MGLPTVDRILRGTLIPDAHGWLAVEAVTVALAGAEPWLTAPGGPLTALTADVLLDPWHRDLWNAYGRLRATGDLVAPLSEDVLGAAVAAAGCDDPAGAVTYLADLWAAGWRDSIGVGVARAVELLTGRAEYLRNVNALAAQGAALGLYDVPALRVMPTPQDTPHPRVSNFAGGGNYAENLDTPPRPSAATPTGDAVRQPASGGERCPNPYHRVYHDADAGTLETRPVPCVRKACPVCGDRWKAERIVPVIAALNGAPAYRLTAERGNAEAALLRRVKRAGGEYLRVPTADGVAVMVLTDVAVSGAEPVAAVDVLDVVDIAMEALRNVGGANVTASHGWRESTQVEAPADDVDSTDTAGVYLGNALDLDRVEKVLRRPWWNVTVTRTGDRGRERLRATGVTPDVVDALWNERVLYDAETLAADRAMREARADRLTDINLAVLDQYEADYSEWCDRGAA